MIPSADNTLTAFKPSTVIGILTTIFGWIAAISLPSLIMPSASTIVAFTSPLIGPSTIVVISLITSLKSLPSFAIRDGLVVTPQITPMSFAFLMSSTFAVSIKNFIFLYLALFSFYLQACHSCFAFICIHAISCFVFSFICCISLPTMLPLLLLSLELTERLHFWLLL